MVSFDVERTADGEWKDDKRHGKGKVVYVSGISYEVNILFFFSFDMIKKTHVAIRNFIERILNERLLNRV